MIKLLHIQIIFLLNRINHRLPVKAVYKNDSPIVKQLENMKNFINESFIV